MSGKPGKAKRRHRRLASLISKADISPERRKRLARYRSNKKEFHSIEKTLIEYFFDGRKKRTNEFN